MAINGNHMSDAEESAQRKARKGQIALAAALWAEDPQIDLQTAAKNVGMVGKRDGKPRSLVKYAARALHVGHEDVLGAIASGALSGRSIRFVLDARETLDLTRGGGCPFTAQAYFEWRANGGKWSAVYFHLAKQLAKAKVAAAKE